MPAAFLVAGARRRGAGARHHPLPLRPPARDAARHLGHQPDASADGARRSSALRTRGRQPGWMTGGSSHARHGPAPTTASSIIVFAIMVLAGSGALLQLHPLRPADARGHPEPAHGSAMGIRTGRVDTMTFGLGSGIAGSPAWRFARSATSAPISARAISSTCFMVVVFGGVGNLCGRAGRRHRPRRRQQVPGAAMPAPCSARSSILVFIILFIQKRPRGLFALKGRAAEA